MEKELFHHSSAGEHNSAPNPSIPEGGTHKAVPRSRTRHFLSLEWDIWEPGPDFGMGSSMKPGWELRSCRNSQILQDLGSANPSCCSSWTLEVLHLFWGCPEVSIIIYKCRELQLMKPWINPGLTKEFPLLPKLSIPASLWGMLSSLIPAPTIPIPSRAHGDDFPCKPR